MTEIQRRKPTAEETCDVLLAAMERYVIDKMSGYDNFERNPITVVFPEY